jgi:hypothetical protein
MNRVHSPHADGLGETAAFATGHSAPQENIVETAAWARAPQPAGPSRRSKYGPRPRRWHDTEGVGGVKAACRTWQGCLASACGAHPPSLRGARRVALAVDLQSRATFRCWKNFNPINSITFILFDKYCLIINQLGSKDSSRDFQLNCVISYFFTYIYYFMHGSTDWCDGKRVKKFQLLESISRRPRYSPLPPGSRGHGEPSMEKKKNAFRSSWTKCDSLHTSGSMVLPRICDRATMNRRGRLGSVLLLSEKF